MANEYLADKCDDIERGVNTMLLQLHCITENGEKVMENLEAVNESSEEIKDLLIEVNKNHRKDHEAVESKLKRIRKYQTRSATKLDEIQANAEKQASEMKSQLAGIKREYDEINGLIKCNTRSAVDAQGINMIQTQLKLELFAVKEKMDRDHVEMKQMFGLMIQKQDETLSVYKQNFKSINEKLNDLKRKHDQMEISSMAARRNHILKDYRVSRLVGEVREDLLCSICQEVPNDPVLCRNNDHIFCLAHISQHLENSQTCPVCRDYLTQETLRRPTGFLKNYLDDLKIKCDHHDRGCPDVVRLENLQRHVYQCGFAPVMCGNEGCGMVVNKRDKDNHEKSCRLGIAKFRNQGQMGEKVVTPSELQSNKSTGTEATQKFDKKKDDEKSKRQKKM